ncbi:MAG: amino acid adenylation domain-containing protein [Gemmatimonadota bacterium]
MKGTSSTLAPLSWMQEQIYFMERLSPENPAYHSGLGLRLIGALDVDALERALGEVVRRHSVLRSRIQVTEAGPLSEVLPFEAPGLRRVSFALATGDDPLASGRAWGNHDARSPMSLEQGPLYRFSLLELGNDDHLLIVVLHHLVSDTWTHVVLVREVLACYRAFINGQKPRLPELPIQYEDFARGQRARLDGTELNRGVQYWRRALEDSTPWIELPGDRLHAAPGVNSDRVQWTVPGDLVGSVRALGSTTGATPFMVLTAALGTLLSRYCGGDRVVVAAVFSSRVPEKVKDLAGCFINTLPLPVDLGGDPTVAELVDRVRAMVLGGFEHLEVPLSKVVTSTQVGRVSGGRPFHQVLINFKNHPVTLGGVAADGLLWERVRITPEAPAVDLALEVAVQGDVWNCELEYDVERLDADAVEQIRGHLTVLLEGMTKDPRSRVHELPILTGSERRRLVEDWNDTATPFPRDATVPSVFTKVAKSHARSIAVTDGKRVLRFDEIDALSDRLAERLVQLGARPGCAIGIQIPRSAENILSMVAVLKTGAAYIPLDPDHPVARNERILSGAGARLVMTSRNGGGHRIQGVEELVVDLDSLVGSEPGIEVAGEAMDTACIMYTSGSSGEPKGVAVPHRAILRLVSNTDYVQLGPGDVVAHVSNPAFDAATFEVWGPLLTGARLVVLDRQTVLSPCRLARALRDHEVTTLFLTTALFNVMAKESPGAFEPLREVLFGGEAVDPQFVRRVLTDRPPRRLLHVYGPTEVATFATWFRVEEVPAQSSIVPIGKPIANTTAYVLDERRRLVPERVAGELYLGGDGVASGYMGDRDGTRERFVPDPFSLDQEARLYRTGDRVRRRRDGALEFLGRYDRQVKIRGFRIEPAEIERSLCEHPAVSSCVVDLWETEGEKRLAAWVVSSGQTLDLAALARFLRRSLPAHMVPSAFVPVATLPLTANGKIDRRALRGPDSARRNGFAEPLDAHTRAERGSLDELEATLVKIWEEVLKTQGIGLHDDFFEDLGGDSLLAVHLFSLVERRLGVELPPEVLFRSSTISDLATEVRGSRVLETGALFPLQPLGTLSPLFCLHGGGGHLLIYRDFARCFAPHRPVYGFGLARALRIGFITARVEAMAERYLEELVQFRPDGPYHLAGYSYGGLVAWEIARRLKAAGREVGLLVMFDAARRPLRTLSRPARARLMIRAAASIGKGNMQRVRVEPPSGWIGIAGEKVGGVRSRLRARSGLGVDPAQDRDLLAMCRLASRRYRPQPYAGDLVYFCAQSGLDDEDLIWRRLTGGRMQVIRIPAAHLDFFKSGSIAMAEQVKGCLEDVEQGPRASVIDR